MNTYNDYYDIHTASIHCKNRNVKITNILVSAVARI